MGSSSGIWQIPCCEYLEFHLVIDVLTVRFVGDQVFFIVGNTLVAEAWVAGEWCKATGLLDLLGSRTRIGLGLLGGQTVICRTVHKKRLCLCSILFTAIATLELYILNASYISRWVVLQVAYHGYQPFQNSIMNIFRSSGDVSA
jgi:hypothetical protein